jgi:hypothetical protein
VDEEKARRRGRIWQEGTHAFIKEWKMFPSLPRELFHSFPKSVFQEESVSFQKESVRKKCECVECGVWRRVECVGTLPNGMMEGRVVKGEGPTL